MGKATLLFDDLYRTFYDVAEFKFWMIMFSATSTTIPDIWFKVSRRVIEIGPVVGKRRAIHNGQSFVRIETANKLKYYTRKTGYTAQRRWMEILGFSLPLDTFIATDDLVEPNVVTAKTTELKSTAT